MYDFNRTPGGLAIIADPHVPRGSGYGDANAIYCHPHDYALMSIVCDPGATVRDVINGSARLRYLERRAKVRGVPIVWPKTPAELWLGATPYRT